ncbi:TPA: bacteriocin-protection protein, YdeI/OmpD-associated family [Candidatus Micrarchaeota archaeon]|nr:bacteriocin-protection protein, YdeI/OmpD-associated family [Candidatus Micrarchaeota archaeon]HII09749.1 bacteriocin-protection protein, YdeI/OmpD-associated family [Candidatus Micrarchaeota archaeon]
MDNVIAFKSQEEWENWLRRNHQKSNGIWMRRFKKDSGVKDIKGSDALDVALCYGWITGQAKRHDELSVLWWFCPRRPKSLWSKLNTMHAERLIKEGRMKGAGLKQIESAKEDGRWSRAYSQQSIAVLPKDFIKEINKNKKAAAFLNTLNRSNVYAIIFRLETTKSMELRNKKIKIIIRMLARGEKPH